MNMKNEAHAGGHERHIKVLCIDNHASSTYALYLLRRCGYEVYSAGFLCDALELIRRTTYDVFLINDEMARAGKQLLEKLREAAGAIPTCITRPSFIPSALGWRISREAHWKLPCPSRKQRLQSPGRSAACLRQWSPHVTLHKRPRLIE